MRIIHIADLHIGNSFYGHDRSDEHRHFFNFLLGVIEKSAADVLVVAGDVFDNPNPSAEAQSIYYDFISSACRRRPGLQMVIIAGNHDSAARLEASSPVLEGMGVHVRGYAHCSEDDSTEFERMIIPLHSLGNAEEEVICIAVPFVRAEELPPGDSFNKRMGDYFRNIISEARHRYGKDKRMILAAHFYATGSEICESDHSERIVVGGEENVDASSFCKGLDYVALGHIHKAQAVGGLGYVRYSGSALPMSFGERGYKHGVNIVDISPDGTTSMTVAEYEPLRKLISVPYNSWATPEEAESLIGRMSKVSDDPNAWNYAELRLKDEPDQPTLYRLKELMNGVGAELCAVRTQETEQMDFKKMEVRTEEQLRQLEPLHMAMTIYSNAHDGEEMPQALVDKFNTAYKMAQDEADAE